MNRGGVSLILVFLVLGSTIEALTDSSEENALLDELDENYKDANETAVNDIVEEGKKLNKEEMPH